MAGVVFEAREACYRYPGADSDAVLNVNLVVRSGELVGIVGPNGSGKTTLLRLLLGLVAPRSGGVTALQRPAATWNRREFARVVGAVTQREEPAFPMRVRQAVSFGRYPHLGSLGRVTTNDRAIVTRMMERCHVDELSARWVATLSGGEWQRVRIARALAQEPKALVLDEPTANLDVRHEMEVFELVTELVRERDLAGVIVTHHLNLVARFADRLMLMDRGMARAVGAPNEVLQDETLRAVFDWPVEVVDWRGLAQVQPLRRHET